MKRDAFTKQIWNICTKRSSNEYQRSIKCFNIQTRILIGYHMSTPTYLYIFSQFKIKNHNTNFTGMYSICWILVKFYKAPDFWRELNITSEFILIFADWYGGIGGEGGKGNVTAAVSVTDPLQILKLETETLPYSAVLRFRVCSYWPRQIPWPMSVGFKLILSVSVSVPLNAPLHDCIPFSCLGTIRFASLFVLCFA